MHQLRVLQFEASDVYPVLAVHGIAQLHHAAVREAPCRVVRVEPVQLFAPRLRAAQPVQISPQAAEPYAPAATRCRVIDEVGFIPFEHEANLFLLVASRYEGTSLIVTCNKEFGRWGEVFGDDTAVGARSAASSTTPTWSP